MLGVQYSVGKGCIDGSWASSGLMRRTARDAWGSGGCIRRSLEWDAEKQFDKVMDTNRDERDRWAPVSIPSQVGALGSSTWRRTRRGNGVLYGDKGPFSCRPWDAMPWTGSWEQWDATPMGWTAALSRVLGRR